MLSPNNLGPNVEFGSVQLSPTRETRRENEKNSYTRRNREQERTKDRIAMASSTAAAISKALQAANIAARAIHVKIHPTARTIAERREVLRVLEGFGEVEMFKSLKVCLASSLSSLPTSGVISASGGRDRCPLDEDGINKRKV